MLLALSAPLASLVSVHTLLTARLAASPASGLFASDTPTPTPTTGLSAIVNGAKDAFPDPATIDCDPSHVSVCGLVVKAGGNKELGQVLDVVLGTPLRVLMIIILGVVTRRVVHRLIDRLTERISKDPSIGDPPDEQPAAGGSARVRRARLRRTAVTPVTGPAAGTSPLLTNRRQARARTLASVLRGLTTALIVAIVVLMVLQELGFSVAPLLASAGVVGIALGLGAQSLVRDVVAGMFMIVEDQYGVGDVVDVGSATGSVEAVGLRVTRLRDVNGTVWYVRNGEIMRVGNQSQGWARAVLDVNVGYGEDVDRVREVLLDTAGQLRAEPAYSPFLLDDPEVWGIEQLSSDGVVMRLVVRTQPMQQWTVARELRRRIKQRFDADGIAMRTVPGAVVIDEDDEPDPHHTAQADAVEQ